MENGNSVISSNLLNEGINLEILSGDFINKKLYNLLFMNISCKILI